jgi:hypothetical protein
MPDPVQRSNDRKGGELDVARLDRTIHDALADVIAKGPIYSPFARAGNFLVCLGEIARIEPDEAGPEVARHDQRVTLDQFAKLVKPASAASIDLGDTVFCALLSQRTSLEQDLVLAPKIIIERGLGDVQAFRDLVEGGAMIALFEKQLHGSSQHGFALLVARAAATFERHPG